jgi:hypothetical protein
MGVLGSKFKAVSLVVYDQDTKQVLAVTFRVAGVDITTWPVDSVTINRPGSVQKPSLSFSQMWGTQIITAQEVIVIGGKNE